MPLHSSNSSDVTYYDALGVPVDATPEQLRAAYRRLALKYHPDRNTSPGAARRFQLASDAYAVLNDPERRREYDRLTVGRRQQEEERARAVKAAREEAELDQLRRAAAEASARASQYNPTQSYRPGRVPDNEPEPISAAPVTEELFAEEENERRARPNQSEDPILRLGRYGWRSALLGALVLGLVAGLAGFFFEAAEGRYGAGALRLLAGLTLGPIVLFPVAYMVTATVIGVRILRWGSWGRRPVNFEAAEDDQVWTRQRRGSIDPAAGT